MSRGDHDTVHEGPRLKILGVYCNIHAQLVVQRARRADTYGLAFRVTY